MVSTKKWLFLLLAAGLLVGMTSCSSQQPKEDPLAEFYNPPPPPLAAGKRYVYRHTGPQPWSYGQKDATGRRIVMVTGKTQETGLWRVEETFEIGPGRQIGFYDDKYRLVRQILVSGDSELHLAYDKPVQERYPDLEKNESMTYNYTQTLFQPSHPQPIGRAYITDQTQRSSYNVRIVTPAGAYLCRVFHSNVKIETNIQGKKAVMTGSIRTYWNDKISWFVKEEATFKPLDGEKTYPSFQTVSILESF